MAVDLAAVRARYRLSGVARRYGVTVEVDTGDVFVRCPLAKHPGDNTPSMLLHLDTDRFHCFGCGAQGDVVQLVEDILGIEFLDAVRALESETTIVPDARRDTVRVAVISRSTRSGAEHPDLTRSAASRVLAAIAAAWNFYSSEQRHDRAVQYLAGRGINVTHLEAETGEKAAGHTPDQATGLRNRLRSQGFADDELVDSSLINRYSGGRAATDFFRHRVIVPSATTRTE
jgi:DNA primase